MPTSRKQLERPRARLALAHLQVDEQRLHDLLPDRQDRVERGHRLLEDHRDVAAAHLAHVVVGEIEQVSAGEQDAAGGDAAGFLGQKPHDGERGHRLAAAGFADDRHRFARPDGVRNAVDRAHDAARGLEPHVQVLHLEQRRARAVRRRTIRQCFHPGCQHAKVVFVIFGCVAIADRPANGHPNRRRIDGRNGRGGTPQVDSRRC